MWPSIFPSTTRSLENLIVPLISTSELSTLRPLGLVPLGRDAEGLLALDADALVGVSFLAGPAEDVPDSGFCPITF